ncbi:MAG: hypothetical protein AB7P01_14600 [Bacteroidia bacterium]
MTNEKLPREKIILALYPNNNGFGYAFFENAQTPIDCGMAKVRPISNSGCLKRIKSFIAYVKPTMIILQRLEGSKSWKTKRVKTLIQEIATYAQSQRLKVKEYSRDNILAVFSQFRAQTKYEIAKRICHWLPQFKNKMPKQRLIYEPESYSMGMFDAISLALTHYLQ